MILPGAKIIQIAWVVDNLETAAEKLSRSMQCGPFLMLRHIQLDDPHHRGRPQRTDFSLCLALRWFAILRSFTASPGKKSECHWQWEKMMAQRKRSLMMAMSPREDLVATRIEVTRIQHYGRNPRRQQNPEYDRIKASIRNGGLDDWVEYFGLQVLQRHNASADALVTAEIALILFSRAHRQGLESPAALASALSRWQRRQHAPAL